MQRRGKYIGRATAYERRSMTSRLKFNILYKMEIEEPPGKEIRMCYFDPVEAALCND